MRVLHVAPSIARAYGGPTQSLAGYVRAAALGGIETVVAAPTASAEEIEALHSAGASEVRTFSSFGRRAMCMSPALVRWLRGASKEYDVTHVHGLFNPISTFGARAAIHEGSAVIIRPFGTLSRYTFTHRRGTLKRAWFSALERRNIESAAGLHFTTAAEREGSEWHGLSGATSYVVPPPWISPNETPNHGGDDARPVVLFLSRINRVKNIAALIAAWPAVIRSVPSARLVIAGSGDAAYEAELHSQAAGLGVESSVSFPGFLSGREKSDALAGASLFLLPSHHENFGMAVLEALAAGTPVVISPEVQLRDFVTTHQLGRVAEANPADIASAIVDGLADRALRDRVAAHGHRIVEETYGAAVVGEQLCSMYVGAMHQHRSRRKIS
ncbi:MAG: glycosyltransferase [Gemmatimonadales bacterium]